MQHKNETRIELTTEHPTSISAAEEDHNERENEVMKNAEKLVEKSVELLLEKFSQYGCSETVIKIGLGTSPILFLLERLNIAILQ